MRKRAVLLGLLGELDLGAERLVGRLREKMGQMSIRHLFRMYYRSERQHSC